MTSPRPADRPLKLTRAQRLLRKSQFDATFASGRRFQDAMFVLTVNVQDREAGAPAQARLGLAVAVRTIGNAVARNRVRRLIRETFRLAQHALPAADIVVSARAPARAAPSAQLRASLEQLWSKVSRQCAASSPR